MTAPLRDLLGELADHVARDSAHTAPDVRTEALQLRSRIRRLRARRLTAVAVGTAAVLAAGIVTANALSAPTIVLPAVPDTSETVTSTPDPSETITSAPDPSPTPAQPTEAATPGPTATTPPATPPVAADLTHGNEVWGVYVAVVDSFESAEALAAKARITELGYESSGGDVGCDQGAAEALGLDPSASVVATYFTTEADAATFAQMYGPDVLGIAKVTLYCLD